MRATLAALLLFTAEARGDDLRRVGPGSVITEDGYYLTHPAYSKLDAEVRRLQESETRLAAENKSLRNLAPPAPIAVIIAVGIGFALGAGTVGYLVITHH